MPEETATTGRIEKHPFGNIDEIKCSFDSVGFFVEPTIVETTSTKDKIFNEEIFGPILTAYVYKDADAESMLNTVIEDTPYALTGAIYSQDQ